MKRKKSVSLRELNSGATVAIKEKAKEKFEKAKNPLVIGKLFLELVIVIAIAVWLAPGINVIPYPENLIGFVLVVLAYLYLRFGLKV
ncbi:MAG: hypothetical protein WC602_00495 [archaeon]